MVSRIPKSSSQRGFALYTVLFAAVIVMLILFAATQSMLTQGSFSRKVDTTSVLKGVQTQVLDSADCEQTLADPSNSLCSVAGGPSPVFINLKNHRGGTLIGQNGTKIGLFTLRARCQPGPGGGIEVRAAWLTGAGEGEPEASKFESSNPAWYRPDEMNTSLRYNWNHPKTLLAGVAGVKDNRLCTSFFDTSGSSSCPTGFQKTGTDPVTGAPVCVPMSKGIQCVSLSVTMSKSKGIMRNYCPAGHVLTGCAISDKKNADKDVYLPRDGGQYCFVTGGEARRNVRVDARCCRLDL